MDLNKRLEEIRELAGFAPLPDPGVIQGFGPEDPPPPADYTPRPPVDLSQVPEAPAEYIDDEPETDFYVSPEPDKVKVVRMLDLQVEGHLAQGYFAKYLDQTVTLTDKESDAIKRVVVLALKRVLRERMAALGMLARRRTRRAREVSGEKSPDAAGVGAPPKRKRGRPRKEQS